MKQRIVVAVVGIPLLLAILCVAPDWATAALLAALGVVGTHELLAAALAHALEQHVELAAHILAVLLGADLGLELYELIESGNLDLLGHIVGQMLGGVGAGALGVLEHEGAVEALLAHEREGELMVFLGLVVVAHKEVGRYATVGYDASYGGYALQIVLAGVLAVHQMEYLVGAALCREVYVVAEIGLLGNGVEYVVGHILGVGGLSLIHL